MAQTPRERAGASGTVLIVDRDRPSRVTARRLLESEGYQVLDASDGPGAEQIATLYVGPIHVLLIEAATRATEGRGLADRLQSLHPEVVVLFASDRSQRELVRLGLLEARAPFVRKPFERGRLTARVRDALVPRR